MNKYYKILELDKIIEKLTQEIRIDDNLDKLNELELSNDIDKIRTSLDETDEAVRIIFRMGRFEILFTKNVNLFVLKAKKNMVLAIDDFIEIGRFLDTVKNTSLFNQSLKNANIDAPIFNNYVDKLCYSKDYNLRLKEVFSNSGEILDSASPLLKQIRKSILDFDKNITTKLNEIINKNTSKLTQPVVTMRNDRYVIPVKNDYKNSFKGLVHDTSSSGETVFIEPLVILEMNNKLNSLKEEEKREINRILSELSSDLVNHEEEINISYLILLDLDMIFSKASLSIKLDGHKPNVNNQGILELIECHHPLLNVEKVVKNNIIVGKEYNGIIITGPNTGGKTVLLKTIGLLSLMVKMGLLIPCDESSNIMIFTDVFSDIGDEQSIDQNLSTFSSHLKNVIDIINKANDKSLVLLDELGSGTDPSEGAALAISIFDYFIKKKCLVITSSHYAELKVHAFESPYIINASVEFDINTLKPTYKLLMGVPGESNALKISKILGLPEEILETAEKYAYQNTNEINLTLDKLTKTSNELEKKLNEIRDKEYRINKRLDEIDDLKDKINKEKRQILQKAEQDAKELVLKKEKEIEELLVDLKNLKNKEIKTHEISDLTHKYNDLRIKESSKTEKAFKIDREIQVNDSVYVEKFNSYGVVTKIIKNKYEVQIGNASLMLTKDDLELTNVKYEDNTVTPRKEISIKPRKTVSSRLDLRGMRYEEAEGLIDSYISDAHYAGLPSVSIIHGFGTGVIRELVQKKLKNNRLVKSFRYGGQNEGGQGATIVFFE